MSALVEDPLDPRLSWRRMDDNKGKGNRFVLHSLFGEQKAT